MDFLARRLAEERAAAVQAVRPQADIHRQLAEDYAAVLEAYRNYAEALRKRSEGAAG
ncbi:MAG: hypothetical protein ACFBQW_00755 [Sphingomonadaceae bacterium]